MALRVIEGSQTADVGEQVRTAQDKLASLIRTAQVTGDPSAAVLEGLAATLAAFHGLSTNVGTQIEQARQPLRDDDLRVAVGGALQAHAGVMVKSLSWGMRIGAIGVVVATAAVFGAGGYWAGWDGGYAAGVKLASVFAQLSPADARAWSEIIQNNPPGAEVRAHCLSVTENNGRGACKLPIWTTPARPP